jgi:hypothetical protein
MKLWIERAHDYGDLPARERVEREVEDRLRAIIREEIARDKRDSR